MEDNLLTNGSGIRNLLLLFPLLSPVDRRKLGKCKESKENEQLHTFNPELCWSKRDYLKDQN